MPASSTFIGVKPIPLAGVRVDAIVGQNPEFLEVLERTGRTPEEFLAINLLLVDFIVERVNGLFQGAATKG